MVARGLAPRPDDPKELWSTLSTAAVNRPGKPAAFPVALGPGCPPLGTLVLRRPRVPPIGTRPGACPLAIPREPLEDRKVSWQCGLLEKSVSMTKIKKGSAYDDEMALCGIPPGNRSTRPSWTFCGGMLFSLDHVDIAV